MTDQIHDKTKASDIRRFGIIAFLFFGALCAVGFWREKSVPVYLFGSLSVVGIGCVVAPKVLAPLYNRWIRLAHFIGKMINVIVLAITYYFVVSPIALVRRMVKGPLLPMKPDKSASSYWVSRTEPVQPVERFIKRY